MKVIGLIRNSKSIAFSFEILPPLRGNSVQKAYNVIDKSKEFGSKYINITFHHSEPVYKTLPDGSFQEANIRKHSDSVAVASAIQSKCGISAVLHIICKGFTKDETGYALIDLNFLGVNSLLILRGDIETLEASQQSPELHHDHATDLQQQVNHFNEGITLDGFKIDGIETPFSYDMACYPERHEEAPNMESDIYYLKGKVKNGAEYLVAQMFFDNEKYYAFVDRCCAEGIMVPIIPGIRPIVFKDQLTVFLKIFRADISEPFATELRKRKDDAEAREVDVEWCIQQCKDLIVHGVPSLRFYTMMVSDSVYKITKEIY